MKLLSINKRNIIEIVSEQLDVHGLTIKSIIITLLGMTLPFVFPFIGITILVLIDFWTSYKAGKAVGLNLYSEGLRKCGKKWTEYFLTLIVCIIVDAIIMTTQDYWEYIFSNVALVWIAITELKSISENFAGVSLSKVLKIVIKYVSSQFTNNKKEIADLLKEEVDSKKFKEFKIKEGLNKQEQNKEKGLKTEDKTK